MVKGYRKMLYQKLVYTAVTRSRKRLFIIGDLDALKIASKNTDSDIRRTTIKDYFINGIV
jgi:ATP-dependent exoDNAse (exonuclease V) alpha subunit